MTFTRLSVILCIGIAIIDFKFNNGRLADALWDQAALWGAWLEYEFSTVVNRLTGHR